MSPLWLLLIPAVVFALEMWEAFGPRVHYPDLWEQRRAWMDLDDPA